MAGNRHPATDEIAEIHNTTKGANKMEEKAELFDILEKIEKESGTDIAIELMREYKKMTEDKEKVAEAQELLESYKKATKGGE